MSVDSFGFRSESESNLYSSSSKSDRYCSAIMTSSSPNPRMGVLPPGSGPHDFSKIFAAAAAAASGGINNHTFPMPEQNLTQHLLASNPQSMQSAWFRLQQQALLASREQERKQSLSMNGPSIEEVNEVEERADVMENGFDDGDKLDEEVKQETQEEELDLSDEHQVRKKARVESIVSNFHQSDDVIEPNPNESLASMDNQDADMPDAELQNIESDPKDSSTPVHSPVERPRSSSKRKSSQPLRAVDEVAKEEERTPDNRPNLNRVQELIAFQNRLYLNFMTEKRISEQQAAARNIQTSEERSPGSGTDSETGAKTHVPKDIKNLGQTLKSELTSALTSTIDKIFTDYLTEAARIASAQNQMRQQVEAGQNAAAAAAAARSMWSPFYPNLCQYPGFGGSSASMAPSIFPGFPPGTLPNNPPAPFMQAGTPFGGSPNSNLRKESHMDGFSVLTGQSRKKRSKVTDTRLSKMQMKSAGDDSRCSTPTAPTSGGYFPPTMVGHPLYPSFGSLGSEDRDPSPSNSDGISDMGNFESNNNSGQTCSLTPLHLRKAKLLFFWTRYPSSNMLKSYFPDVRFNKNTTAQLVKWFSNFREFYYIQMDKYARQAQQEGILKPEDIVVSTESEIYRVLNQHYNRNNHIQVPSTFRHVVESTLREFFLAIVAGKDAESSWKKQIYKVIARLDDSIPEYFKNPNFIEQLE